LEDLTGELKAFEEGLEDGFVDEGVDESFDVDLEEWDLEEDDFETLEKDDFEGLEDDFDKGLSGEELFWRDWSDDG